MSEAADFRTGKGHKDENFPVASFILKPVHRAPIMAFYRFARTADDVADHATLSEAEKLQMLGAMGATLAGDSDENPEALVLRGVLAERGLPDIHGLDLLKAFTQDVTKRRYADWAELMDYCRYSASPVGRFVLDVHGESRDLWPANDALCSALQVINHLQDCAKDHAEIDRVYLPEDQLARAGTSVQALAAPGATPELKGRERSRSSAVRRARSAITPFSSGVALGAARAWALVLARAS